jgi:uncharacterized phage-like protein YoqJ
MADDPPRWPVVAFTGHRGRAAGSGAWARRTFAEVVLPRLRDEHGTAEVTTGMALDADQWWTYEAIRCPGIRVVAYIPFTEQPDRWPPVAQDRYWWLLDQVDEIVPGGPLGDRDAVQLLHARNDRMLDASRALVALWDPSVMARSGTYSAVAKGRRRKLPIVHVDPAAQAVTWPKPKVEIEQEMLPL